MSETTIDASPQFLPHNTFNNTIVPADLGRVLAHGTLLERMYFRKQKVALTVDLLRNDGCVRKNDNSFADLYLLSTDMASAFGLINPSAVNIFNAIEAHMSNLFSTLSVRDLRANTLRKDWASFEPIWLAYQRGAFSDDRKTAKSLLDLVTAYNATLALQASKTRMAAPNLSARALAICKSLSVEEKAVVYAIRNRFPITPPLTQALNTLTKRMIVLDGAITLPLGSFEVGAGSYQKIAAQARKDEKAPRIEVDTASLRSLDVWALFAKTLLMRGDFSPAKMTQTVQSPILNVARESSIRRILSDLDLLDYSPALRKGTKTLYTYKVYPKFLEMDFNTTADLEAHIKGFNFGDAQNYSTFLDIVRENTSDKDSVILNSVFFDRMINAERPVTSYDLENYRTIGQAQGRVSFTKKAGVYIYAAFNETADQKNAPAKRDHNPLTNPEPAPMNTTNTMDTMTALDNAYILSVETLNTAVLAIATFKIKRDPNSFTLIPEIVNAFTGDATPDDVWSSLISLANAGKIQLDYNGIEGIDSVVRVTREGFDVSYMIPKNLVRVTLP